MLSVVSVLCFPCFLNIVENLEMSGSLTIWRIPAIFFFLVFFFFSRGLLGTAP